MGIYFINHLEMQESFYHLPEEGWYMCSMYLSGNSGGGILPTEEPHFQGNKLLIILDWMPSKSEGRHGN